jgi:hypothetical protein
MGEWANGGSTNHLPLSHLTFLLRSLGDLGGFIVIRLARRPAVVAQPVAASLERRSVTALERASAPY